jgi:hypothetical protein
VGPGEAEAWGWLWLLPGRVVLVVRVVAAAGCEAIKNVRFMVSLALKPFILGR